jgi:hypothetical protein
MRHWTLALLGALAPVVASAQVTTIQGETKQLCRLWDGTDVLAIDSAGAISCNAGTNLNTSALLTTSAHDAAFGTAGSADAQVRTIQGIASMTPVQVSQATASNLNAQVVGPAADGAAVSGNPVRIAGKDGSGNTQDIATDSSGEPQVDVLTLPNVTIGTFPDNEPFNVAQVAGTAVAAHDGGTLEAPLLTSAYAETPEDSDGNTSGNRVSADADKVRLLASRYGVLYTDPCHGPFKWTYHEDSSNALTDTTVHASCGTGLYNYICSITFSTGGATAASLKIEDSTTDTILGPYYTEAVAGRGFHVTYPGGKKQTNSATLVSVTTTGAVAHGLDIQGYCAP